MLKNEKKIVIDHLWHMFCSPSLFSGKLIDENPFVLERTTEKCYPENECMWIDGIGVVCSRIALWEH